MPLEGRYEELKQKFLTGGGVWGDDWNAFLELDPLFFEKYLNWMLVPVKKRHLPTKVQEFIYITVNAAATHLHVPGIRFHIRAALAVGATKEEIMEVLELTSTVGIHACNIGIPLLVEVLKEEGMYTAKPMDEYRERLKDEFIASRGYWHVFWDDFLKLDPEFFEGYTAYSSSPWKTGSLEPKYKELIYCAFDCAATHLYRPGLRVHMQNALRLGATADQIMEVLEIASLLGIHGVTQSMPILKEEVERVR